MLACGTWETEVWWLLPLIMVIVCFLMMRSGMCGGMRGYHLRLDNGDDVHERIDHTNNERGR